MAKTVTGKTWKDNIKKIIVCGLAAATVAAAAIFGFCKLTTKNKSLSKTVDKQQTTIDDKDEQIGGLQGENAGLEKNVEDLQAQLAALRDQLANNPENEELRKQIEELEKQIANQNPVQELNFTEDQLKDIAKLTGNEKTKISGLKNFIYEGGKLSMYFDATNKHKENLVVSVSVNAEKSFDQHDVLQWLDDAADEASIDKRPDVKIYKDIEAYDFENSAMQNVQAMNKQIMEQYNNKKALKQTENIDLSTGNSAVSIGEYTVLYSIESSMPAENGDRNINVSMLYLDANGTVVDEEKNVIDTITINGKVTQNTNYQVFKAVAAKFGVKEPESTQPEETESQA